MQTEEQGQEELLYTCSNRHEVFAEEPTIPSQGAGGTQEILCPKCAEQQGLGKAKD